MTGAVPIFLARYSAGAGHYNAIIPDKTDHQDPNTPSSTSLSMASSNPTANEKLSCRCNGSKRKKFTKYKKGVTVLERWDGAKHLVNAMVNAENPVVNGLKKRSQVRSYREAQENGRAMIFRNFLLRRGKTSFQLRTKL